jgi:tetratricopeptide (TPR) repeat protein
MRVPLLGVLAGVVGVLLSSDAMGDLDGAIADFTEAIKAGPDYAVAYNNRGFACAIKKDYDRARRRVCSEVQ